MIIFLRKIVLLLFSVYILLVSAYGQENWSMRQDKNGIKVFSRATEKAGFDEFRATMQLNQSIHSFLAVLLDVENLDKWAYNVKNAHLLKVMGDSVQIYYSEVSMPFPFTNRDGIYMNRFTWKNDSSLLLIDIEILPDYMGKKEKYVRIPYGKGFWRVKVRDDKQLDITFQMQVDPGGNIPSWLANMFITTTPTYTLTKLREIIVNEKYQNQKFDWLE